MGEKCIQLCRIAGGKWAGSSEFPNTGFFITIIFCSNWLSFLFVYFLSEENTKLFFFSASLNKTEIIPLKGRRRGESEHPFSMHLLSCFQGRKLPRPPFSICPFLYSEEGTASWQHPGILWACSPFTPRLPNTSELGAWKHKHRRSTAALHCIRVLSSFFQVHALQFGAGHYPERDFQRGAEGLRRCTDTGEADSSAKSVNHFQLFLRRVFSVTHPSLMPFSLVGFKQRGSLGK